MNDCEHSKIKQVHTHYQTGKNEYRVSLHFVCKNCGCDIQDVGLLDPRIIDEDDTSGL